MRLRSAGLRHLLESRAEIAHSDLRCLDEHDRVPGLELVDRAVGSVVVQRGAPQEPPEPEMAGDPGALGVVFVPPLCLPWPQIAARARGPAVDRVVYARPSSVRPS